MTDVVSGDLASASVSITASPRSIEPDEASRHVPYLAQITLVFGKTCASLLVDASLSRTRHRVGQSEPSWSGGFLKRRGTRSCSQRRPGFRQGAGTEPTRMGSGPGPARARCRAPRSRSWHSPDAQRPSPGDRGGGARPASQRDARDLSWLQSPAQPDPRTRKGRRSVSPQRHAGLDQGAGDAHVLEVRVGGCAVRRGQGRDRRRSQPSSSRRSSSD